LSRVVGHAVGPQREIPASEGVRGCLRIRFRGDVRH